MDLVKTLARDAEVFAWFTDRPEQRPADQIVDAVERLRDRLPLLAADMVYHGRVLPDTAAVPTTGELVRAHQTEREEALREKPDYSTAPKMAHDGAHSDGEASTCLQEIRNIQESVCLFEDWQTRLARRLVQETTDGVDPRAIQGMVAFLEQQSDGGAAKGVALELGGIDPEDLGRAVLRGQSGQSPLSFGSALFNGSLKRAIESILIDGSAPAQPRDWGRVRAWLRIHASSDKIRYALAPLASEDLAPRLPDAPAEVALYLDEVARRMRVTCEIARRINDLRPRCLALFPVGLAVDAAIAALDLSPISFALEANLPSGYRAPKELAALEKLAGAKETPLERTIAELRDALSRPETDPAEILDARSAITRELERLSGVVDAVASAHKDLEALALAGAPEWAEMLLAAPENATQIIRDEWRGAWSWAVMMGRVEKVTALGNGDEHRKAKAQAMKRRVQLMGELIRIRTLIGLQRRMTGPVQTALAGFSQAVQKIGKGTGKTAPRWRRAAQVAAKQASVAAPVWIMPEYKIAEQLPPDIAGFDLVILDEASQSDITACAALARGKKLLVVGDEEQVSPSNVAMSEAKISALRALHLKDLPNPDLIDENTSVFEIAMRMFPKTHLILREHFRCVAPIIAFSAKFYGGRLVPLRVPKASERFDPPLVDVHLKAGRRSGMTNEDEARYIVDEIAKIVADSTHAARSIGVISLIGREQAEMIERLLITDDRIGPEVIAKRQIIAGDARTMQGQERSVVFLSMVADPGLVTAQTDKRTQQRFNVAMSRAADRLYLVRSVDRADLKDNDLKAMVIDHFLDPMPDGHKLASNDVFERCESEFEVEVLERLLDAGYRARPQVSAGPYSIDIVVEGAEDRRLAIELDGDRYHPPEVWDRDIARQAALERAGWTFWRVFGSAWEAQKEHYWSALVSTLTAMGIEPIGENSVSDIFTEFRVVDLTGVADHPSYKKVGDEAAKVEEDVRARPYAPGDDRQSSFFL
jgi:very-short-patch-repair endonuclease